MLYMLYTFDADGKLVEFEIDRTPREVAHAGLEQLKLEKVCELLKRMLPLHYVCVPQEWK